MSQQGLNPIKPAYDPCWLARQLAQLTASIFNQQGQYASSPSNSIRFHTEPAISSPGWMWLSQAKVNWMAGLTHSILCWLSDISTKDTNT